MGCCGCLDWFNGGMSSISMVVIWKEERQLFWLKMEGGCAYGCKWVCGKERMTIFSKRVVIWRVRLQMNGSLSFLFLWATTTRFRFIRARVFLYVGDLERKVWKDVFYYYYYYYYYYYIFGLPPPSVRSPSIYKWNLFSSSPITWSNKQPKFILVLYFLPFHFDFFVQIFLIFLIIFFILIFSWKRQRQCWLDEKN